MIEGKWSLAGDGVTGYARDRQRGVPLWVELLADDVVVGIALANLPEPEDCGFFLPVPAAALEDEARLDVRIANTDACLPREGEKAEAPERARLTGEIYVDRALTITGWVLDPDLKDRPLRVLAETGGQVVAEAVAAARFYRLGIADGHGFRLELPESLADGQAHVVSLKDEQGRELPGSPIRVRGMGRHVGEWLRNQKKIEKPMQELLAGILEMAEERLPGVINMARFQDWKKAFPVPPAGKRQKAAVAVWGDAALLRGQQGLELAKGGEFVLLPGRTVRLHAHALAHMLAALREHGAALVYADGETLAGEPLFRPCFDREAFFARDYLGPCLARRDLLAAAGLDMDSPRFDAVMACAGAGRIMHLPLPLSVESQALPGAHAAAAAAWLARNMPEARWTSQGVVYPLSSHPRISIIIPTRDHGALLATCLNSLRQTGWPDYELVIIDNGSVEEEALRVLAEAEQRANVCVLRRPGVFNYASLNNEAARVASGELLCFLNNDTEALHPEWLSEMAALLLMAGEEGGCAGARLLWPNGLVQHGGVIVGPHQLAAHVGNQWLDDEPGYMDRNQFAQRYSAVTAACMLTRRGLFLETGGFDQRRFPIAFNDVDYCLRLGKLGKKVYWTPRARLAHHESASRGKDKAGSAKARAEREMRYFRAMWGDYADPFYNPNLPLSAAVEPFMGLAFPPGAREARSI